LAKREKKLKRKKRGKSQNKRQGTGGGSYPGIVQRFSYVGKRSSLERGGGTQGLEKYQAIGGRGERKSSTGGKLSV